MAFRLLRLATVSLAVVLPIVADGALGAKQGIVAAEGAGAGRYHELFYEQSLDHFQAPVGARWSHRYLLGNESWDGRSRLPNGCRGPILLYCGNEDNVEYFWAVNGFMIDVLAPQWGALLVFPEQRFYGKSQPFPTTPLTAREFAYLTTSQVIEDYVELVAHLKSSLPEASNCPVVAFGGSYGGTLAALIRATRPAVITGALAASSELGYYDVDGWASRGVSQYAFEDIVLEGYAQARPGCLPAVRAAVAALEAATPPEAAKAMRVCSPEALSPSASSLFAYALEGLPQMNYPYRIGIMPASPVGAVCDVLLRGNASIEAAGVAARLAMGIAEGDCIPDQGVGGPGNTPGDGPGPSSWGWQSCTETLHAFSARGLRKYSFDLGASTQKCEAIFGAGVVPDLSALARRFGGYALADGSAGATRIIWSQGTLDPWHGWFRSVAPPPPASDVHHIVMRGAAHHLDLRAPNAADPPDVIRGRQAEASIIRRWIFEDSLLIGRGFAETAAAASLSSSRVGRETSVLV